MTLKQAAPREVLAKNLRQLLEKTGMTGPEVARRAGVDRKTVNNQLNARTNPQSEEVDRVARVFDITGSILLSPAFDAKMIGDKSVDKLLEYYAKADDEGKESILRIAKMAARSGPPKP